MVLGKLPVPGRPTIWMIVGQRPIALAVRAGGVVWTFYSPLSFLSSSPSLWGTARYRLKYCLKGPLNQKQTNKYKSFRENYHLCIIKENSPITITFNENPLIHKFFNTLFSS